MRFYHYPKCSTCRKAKQFLDAAKVRYEEIDITATPPTEKELLSMLKVVGGEVRKLFNTSGILYRELGLKDRVAAMTQAEAIKLLQSNGMLVKRPFLIGSNVGCVGFREAEWKKVCVKK